MVQPRNMVLVGTAAAGSEASSKMVGEERSIAVEFTNVGSIVRWPRCVWAIVMHSVATSAIALSCLGNGITGPLSTIRAQAV